MPGSGFSTFCLLEEGKREGGGGGNKVNSWRSKTRDPSSQKIKKNADFNNTKQTQIVGANSFLKAADTHT